MAALIPLRDEGRVDTPLLDVLLNFLVKARDQPDNDHGDAYTQDNAENGESAAQFMRAQSVHGLLQIFTVRLGHLAFSTFRA